MNDSQGTIHFKTNDLKIFYFGQLEDYLCGYVCMFVMVLRSATSKTLQREESMKGVMAY